MGLHSINMSGKKSPVEIVQARVSELVEIMLSGDNGQIREASRDMAAKWGVSYRQIERYRKAANRTIKDKRNQDIDTVYVRHIQERRELYKTALAEKDLRLALTILQDIGKIEGIYSPEFVALIKNEQNNFDLSTLPPERLEKVLLKYFDNSVNEKVVNDE
jgi:hypothetical protein